MCVWSEADGFVCPWYLPGCGVCDCEVSPSMDESGMSAAAAHLSDSSAIAKLTSIVHVHAWMLVITHMLTWCIVTENLPFLQLRIYIYT